MKTKFIVLALAVMMTGCQTPSSQLNKVHLGMSETDVIKILGQPASIAENHDGKTLYYTLRENGLGSLNAPYSVKLVGGKVDSYGRDSGATGQQPMPVIIPMVH